MKKGSTAMGNSTDALATLTCKLKEDCQARCADLTSSVSARSATHSECAKAANIKSSVKMTHNASLVSSVTKRSQVASIKRKKKSSAQRTSNA